MRNEVLVAIGLSALLAAGPLTAQDDPAIPSPIDLRDLTSLPPGDIERPVANPRNRMPTYTPEARKACVRGAVILNMIIDERGRVSDVKVLKPLSHGLTEKAVKAAKRFRFSPAKVNGNPVAFSYRSILTFKPPWRCLGAGPRHRRLPIDEDFPPPISRLPRPPNNR